MMRFALLACLGILLAACQTLPGGLNVVVDIPCPSRLTVDPATGQTVAVVNGQPVIVEVVSVYGTLKICRLIDPA